MLDFFIQLIQMTTQVNSNKLELGINGPANYYRHFDMKRFWIIFGVTLGVFVILITLASTIDFDI